MGYERSVSFSICLAFRRARRMKRPAARQIPTKTKTASAIRSFIIVGVIVLLLLEPSRTTSLWMTAIAEGAWG